MSHQDLADAMEAWPSTQFRQWIGALTEDSAPNSVLWWLRPRSIAQLHAYDQALPVETRREWADVALSLIECAERFAGYDRWSAVVGATNLRSMVIRELGPVPGNEKWDLDALLRDVLTTATLLPEEARELAQHWQMLPGKQIAALRRHKNLLAPLASLVDQLPAGADAERVRAWLVVLPNLP